MKVSLIVPMYNESGIIEDTAHRLSAYMEERFDSYEILFSDDGSTDGCGELVRNLGLPFVRVTGYGTNRGKGSAVRHGVLEAEGDWILFTDADLAYETDVIGKFYEYYQNREDTSVWIGSRNLDENGYEGYTRLRKWMSRWYLRLLSLLGGFRYSDCQSGCKAFRKDAAKAIFSRCVVDDFSFDFEMILLAEKMGYIIEEIPVKIIHHRESKVRPIRDAFRMLKSIRRIRKRIQTQ